MKLVIGKKASPGIDQNSAGPFPMNRQMGQGSPIPDSKDEVNNMSRRVKMLEERYTNVRSKFQLVEQNMLQKNKSFYTDIKTLNLELTEVKKEINEVKDKMTILLKELDTFARRDSVDILKKYIDLWSPMNFVTRNEVEEIIREVIEKIRKENK